MNLIRKPVKVELNGENYEMIIDMQAAITYDQYRGESILQGLDKVLEHSDMTALAFIVASCLKKDDVAVGIDFVNQIDMFDFVEIFMPKIGELMSNGLPKMTGESTEKKTKKASR